VAPSENRQTRWRSALRRGRLQAGITQADYATALARIAEHLRAGDSYQINFTWPLRGQAFGHPLALYAALRRAQPTRYSCLAKLGGRWVLEFSPELFFSRDGSLLRARPMKGTAPRQANAEPTRRPRWRSRPTPRISPRT
jgi:Anthranilate/para-aminobenzoate synthases component I